METKNKLPYLPHELIVQILLRLPVKSLICFKCVCKSWFSLFSDPQFTNSQFELTAATHIHRALFMSTESPRETRSINLETSLYDDISLVLLNPNFMPPEPSYIEIKGSCRGFLLLRSVLSFYVYSNFYLWNPSTGLYKQIPFSPPSSIKPDYFYGFGYDHSTDDYIVVSMSSDKNSSYWEFFSLRANTWKQIDEGTHIHYSNATEEDRKAGSLFNGVIHWFAYRHDLEKDIIVAFDLMERKPLDMHLPDQFECELDFCGLWVFQEFLSLWSMNYDNDIVEIWVMKEYKVHSSWTKTHVLPTDAIPTKFFYPLRSTKIGDIVGTDEHTGIVKYNDERQLLGHRSYSNNPCGFLVAVYTESLLSLPGDNVQA